MSSFEFPIGSAVAVKRFGEVGRIVAVDSGWARIQLRGIVVKVPISDLSPASQEAIETTRGGRITVKSEAVNLEPSKLFSIDLHGQTVAESIRLLEDQISRAVMAGMHEIEVVHGLGTGRVMKAIHERLSELPAVARYEVKFANRGVTRVFIRG